MYSLSLKRNKMDLKKIGNILFYAILIAGVIYFAKRKLITPPIQAKQLVFEQYNEEGLVDLSAYPDKIVLVNFWQTWCAPCIHEMPSLNDMNQVWDGIQVICVSDEPYLKVQRYIEQYPNIHFVSIESIGKLGISQYPTSYIYNSEGAKVYSKIGAKDWSDPNFIAMLKKNWSEKK